MNGWYFSPKGFQTRGGIPWLLFMLSKVRNFHHLNENVENEPILRDAGLIEQQTAQAV